MTQMVFPTVQSIKTQELATIRFYSEPQMNDCVVYANPCDEINNHPELLAFYNGETNKLAIKHLQEFCRVLHGHTAHHEDETRSFMAGHYILNGIPPEQPTSFFKKQWAKLTGQDTEQYFQAQDRLFIDDFLDNVMQLTHDKICSTKPIPAEPN